MMRSAIYVAALALGLACGCLPSRQSGHFGEAGYYQARDQYRVRFAEAEAGTLLGAPWSLETFSPHVEGRPGHERQDLAEAVVHPLLPGRARPVVQLARFDLRFVRADRPSTIFARSIPLRLPWLGDDVRTLLRRSVASLASTTADAPDLLGEPPGYVAPEVRVVREGWVRLDGERGYFVTFELSRPGPRRGPRSVRAVTIVGVMARRELAVGRRGQRPTLLVLGHTSLPSHHGEEQEALASLARRVDLAPARD